MNTLGLIFLTVILGATGAILFYKLNIPAGVFLGPVVFIGAYQVLWGSLVARPGWLRLAVQIAVGITLGTRMGEVTPATIKKLIKPAVFVCLIMVGGGLCIGIILSKSSGWDIVTSILAAAPGGQAEMALLAASVHAQTEKVIILQLLRAQIVMLLLLPLTRTFLRAKNKEGMKKS